MSKRIKLLGSYVDSLTMEETVLNIIEFIENRSCIQHVVINASKINLINENEELREIVNNCPLINADGQSIVWASKLLGNPLIERVTGIDLFIRLLQVSEEKKYKIYLFGSKQVVLDKLIQVLNIKYPKINIVGYRNGYFKEGESEQIAENIKESGADILFVALPSPQKEYWIKKYMPLMQVPFAMGVGGSFDVLAERTKRAPKWMQKCGLEWFYRFIQEPKRMYKRYLIGNIKFCKLLLKTKIQNINTW